MISTSEDHICPYCQGFIATSKLPHICPRCETAHHEECWEENQGCSASGCRARAETQAGDGEGERPRKQSRPGKASRSRPLALLVWLLTILLAGGAGAWFTIYYTERVQRPPAEVSALFTAGRVMWTLGAMTEVFGERVRRSQQKAGEEGEAVGEDQEDSAAEEGELLTIHIPDPGERAYGVGILSEPSLGSSEVWTGQHGDEVILVSRHGDQNWDPDPYMEYLYWEVEHPETGARGWLIVEWQSTIEHPPYP